MTRLYDVTAIVANVGLGAWRFKYDHLFMTVWLSIFRRSHMVRRGQGNASIYASLRKELGRSLIAPNSLQRYGNSTADGHLCRRRWISGPNGRAEQKAGCTLWQTRPECSGTKRKDPMGYMWVILTVATTHRSTMYNGYNTVIYRKMVAQN